MQLFQYQGHVEPVLVPAAAPSVPGIDAWIPTYPRPFAPRRRPADMASAFVPLVTVAGGPFPHFSRRTLRGGMIGMGLRG